MVRAVLIAFALTLASMAGATDTGPADAKPADSKKAAPSTPQEKADALKKKKQAEEGAKSGKPPKQPPDSPKVAAMKQARAQLIYAADACAIPAKCDKELRDDWAERFKMSCRECDSLDRCDADLTAILAGDFKQGKGLCAPKK